MILLATNSVFSVDFRAKLTPGLLATMNSSPIFLGLIAEAVSKAESQGKILEFRVGQAGDGWTFESTLTNFLIVVEPKGFTDYAANPGGFVLGLAHELGHATDPVGTVAIESHANPIAYALARSRGEGEHAWLIDVASPFEKAEPYVQAFCEKFMAGKKVSRLVAGSESTRVEEVAGVVR